MYPRSACPKQPCHHKEVDAQGGMAPSAPAKPPAFELYFKTPRIRRDAHCAKATVAQPSASRKRSPSPQRQARATGSKPSTQPDRRHELVWESASPHSRSNWRSKSARSWRAGGDSFFINRRRSKSAQSARAATRPSATSARPYKRSWTFSDALRGDKGVPRSLARAASRLAGSVEHDAAAASRRWAMAEAEFLAATQELERLKTEPIRTPRPSTVSQFEQKIVDTAVTKMRDGLMLTGFEMFMLESVEERKAEEARAKKERELWAKRHQAMEEEAALEGRRGNTAQKAALAALAAKAEVVRREVEARLVREAQDEDEVRRVEEEELQRRRAEAAAAEEARRTVENRLVREAQWEDEVRHAYEEKERRRREAEAAAVEAAEREARVAAAMAAADAEAAAQTEMVKAKLKISREAREVREAREAHADGGSDASSRKGRMMKASPTLSSRSSNRSAERRTTTPTAAPDTQRSTSTHKSSGSSARGGKKSVTPQRSPAMPARQSSPRRSQSPRRKTKGKAASSK